MMIMKLNDGTEIQIVRDFGIAELVTATNCLDKLTKENLSHVLFDDGESGEYFNLVLTSYEIIPQDDESLLYYIHLRQPTEIELELIELKESQMIQDTAIEDLGAAVSDLMEG